ncbi:MAG: TadG family pilus assembly protein, partial [bacterium]
GTHTGYYQVTITHPVNMFFAPLLGVNNSTVRAKATASVTSPLPINIGGGGNTYGTNGIQNLSVFGKYGQYSYGDAFSPAWLDNGQVNPLYNPDGYDFKVTIPANYSAINGTNTVKMELFDPETWNVGNATDAGAGKMDEIRAAPGGGHPQPSSQYTTTKYSLYAPSNTPNDPTDDILIATATYGPSTTSTTDMKWVTPTGFQFNKNTYGSGAYRLNVVSLDGSSENGFNLRAGPPLTGSQTFNPNNGTKVEATGSLPINFNVSGTVDIELGDLPAATAGSKVYIDKFDTDVGATSIQYYDDHGHTWPGVLSGNGTWKLDVLNIPTGYTGGKLKARYVAGAQDTSVWQMYFDGTLTGGPSELRLVD